MRRAFFTRNPLLPREYFVPKGVDEFVVKMNQGVEHSLLACPGHYTVQIATFRGKTILQTGREQPKEEGGIGWMWGKNKGEPLVEAAENAHLLTETLRKKGYEAYEFHDRDESIVTIGSFEHVGERLPNGQLAPSPDVQRNHPDVRRCLRHTGRSAHRRRHQPRAGSQRDEAEVHADAQHP